MFHDDGCVKADILTRPYQVVILPDCEHNKIVRVEVTIMAESYKDALSYARNHLCPPRTHVYGE